MSKNIYYLILINVLFSLPVSGVTTTIRCSNIEYANEALTFFVYADPISNTNEESFILTFDQSGNCETNVGIDGPVFSYSDFGIYRGLLLLEPGKTIDLKLPPLKKKSFSDEKNPYFTPTAFWIYTTRGNMLNDKISQFEQKLNELTDKNFNALYFQQSQIAFDNLENEIENTFSTLSSESFKLHKKLRLQLLEADVFRLAPEDYAAVFQDISPKYWHHKSFKTLFDKTFDDQLSFSAKAIGGKKVSEAVGTENIEGLLEFINDKYKLSGKIADLVLLKLLHDGFYSNDFSQKNIEAMIASDYFTENPEIILQKTAKNIHTKITFLETGSKAPVICLNNLSGNEKCTNNNLDKFKYLMFADVETIICQEHLKYLSRVNELFGEHLEIFVVLRDTDRSGIDSFFKQYEVPAQVLLDKGNKTIAEYKIRSFPQCFVLNEKHEVVFNDAKAPLNGFEQEFGSWLQRELFMRQRDQAR